MRPIHVAIIPDGNRRWARAHRMSIPLAYERGIDNIANVIKWCRKYRIRILTMWGFSTENFLRDRNEVRNLFGLFNRKLSDGLKRDYMKYGVRVRFLGQIEKFPKDVREKMLKAELDTAKNRRYQLNLLLAYGGRQEILDAANRAIASGRRHLDEKSFASFLYTAGVPEPDLVIRTSGHFRTSGFMPWQTAYSEFYFSPKLWQDFKETDFKKALDDFARRKRKFGK